MTDKEKILAEIERLWKYYFNDEISCETLSALDKLKDFINSLSEEPVSDVWHNTNEKPNYVEGDTYANSILVFGNTKLGYGASVCNMIDEDTVYAPIRDKEYEWGKCPFTMWAYIRDLLHNVEEPVSDDLENAADKYCCNICNIVEFTEGDSEEEASDREYVERAFKAGAQWQRNKDRVNTNEDFEKALATEWKGYVDRGAAKVDALEDNTQELSFAKGFYRGAQWQKNQRIVEDAEINYWNQRGLSIRIEDKCLEDLGFEEGDKVKVSIIKES